MFKWNSDNSFARHARKFSHPLTQLDRVCPASAATANSFGTPYRRGDANLDRDVDITDFNALASNFMPGGYGGSSRQIPEPSTFLLCVLGLVGAGVLLVSKRRESYILGQRA